MQECPLCHIATEANPRYPKYGCRDCLAGGVVVDGKTVLLVQVDIWSQAEVPCTVSGVRCLAREAHFGGCVVEPIEN